ncbi:MAG: hypothetical protein KDD64_07895 [Bdellovibrionales bacterium]|nr:hypothetical protein [Bdellovibrionales bacterium]
MLNTNARPRQDSLFRAEDGVNHLGLSPKTIERLGLLGIFTLGDLQKHGMDGLENLRGTGSLTKGDLKAIREGAKSKEIVL